MGTQLFAGRKCQRFKRSAQKRAARRRIDSNYVPLQPRERFLQSRVRFFFPRSSSFEKAKVRVHHVSGTKKVHFFSPGAELGSQSGSPGPVETELNTYNSGKVLGLVAGAYAELSSAFHVIIDLIASQLAEEHLQFFDIDHGMCKSIFLQQVRRSLGLALHRRWAKLMLDHCRDLVQHPKQLRSMATEATDEDDEEAHAFYHHTHPPGYWG